MPSHAIRQARSHTTTGRITRTATRNERNLGAQAERVENSSQSSLHLLVGRGMRTLLAVAHLTNSSLACPAQGLQSNTVLIEGEKEAILIDAARLPPCLA